MPGRRKTCKLCISPFDTICGKPIDHSNKILCSYHYFMLRKDYYNDRKKFHLWEFTTKNNQVAFIKFLKDKESTKEPEPVPIIIPKKAIIESKSESELNTDSMYGSDSDSEPIFVGSKRKRDLSYIDEETEGESTCIEMPITKRQTTNHNIPSFDLEKYVVTDKATYDQMKREIVNYDKIVKPAIKAAHDIQHELIQDIQELNDKRSSELEKIVQSFHERTAYFVATMIATNISEYNKIRLKVETDIKKN